VWVIMLPMYIYIYIYMGEHIVAASCLRVSVCGICPGYFSATNDRNSMKLYGKLHYQCEMCILSAGSGRMIFYRVMALWFFFINCTYSAIFLVRVISQQLMTGIQWNFMGSFTTKRRSAYYQSVLVGWFFTELWPFEIFHCTYSAILVRAIS